MAFMNKCLGQLALGDDMAIDVSETGGDRLQLFKYAVGREGNDDRKPQIADDDLYGGSYICISGDDHRYIK